MIPLDCYSIIPLREGRPTALKIAGPGKTRRQPYGTCPRLSRQVENEDGGLREKTYYDQFKHIAWDWVINYQAFINLGKREGIDRFLAKINLLST